ncbi:MAG: hypothetical protein KJ042_18035, partial [Deltaproteobacteria bacterium]|nr:hypothetical protein [Deltaproteobacteria bacterium]
RFGSQCIVLAIDARLARRTPLERDFVNRDRWNAPDDAPVWALELSRAPLEEPPPVTRVAKGEEPVIDGTALPARWTAPPLAWSDRPIDVVSFAHENELYFVLTRPIDERIEGFERTFGGLYDRESKTTGRRPWDSESLAIPTRPWQTNSPRLAFRAMPGRTVHVIDAIYLDPSRIYWRRIELREDGATDRGWNYWHAN